MTRTKNYWEEIKAEFEQGIGFKMNHLGKFKWEQFGARQMCVQLGLIDTVMELESILICENNAYSKMLDEDKSVTGKEYYNECIIINNYLLGAISVLKERV